MGFHFFLVPVIETCHNENPFSIELIDLIIWLILVQTFLEISNLWLFFFGPISFPFFNPFFVSSLNSFIIYLEFVIRSVDFADLVWIGADFLFYDECGALEVDCTLLGFYLFLFEVGRLFGGSFRFGFLGLLCDFQQLRCFTFLNVLGLFSCYLRASSSPASTASPLSRFLAEFYLRPSLIKSILSLILAEFFFSPPAFLLWTYEPLTKSLNVTFRTHFVRIWILRNLLWLYMISRQLLIHSEFVNFDGGNSIGIINIKILHNFRIAIRRPDALRIKLVLGPSQYRFFILFHFGQSLCHFQFAVQRPWGCLIFHIHGLDFWLGHSLYHSFVVVIPQLF